jgi:hypothetical protein
MLGKNNLRHIPVVFSSSNKAVNWIFTNLLAESIGLTNDLLTSTGSYLLQLIYLFLYKYSSMFIQYLSCCLRGIWCHFGNSCINSLITTRGTISFLVHTLGLILRGPNE